MRKGLAADKHSNCCEEELESFHIKRDESGGSDYQHISPLNVIQARGRCKNI